MKNKKIKGQRTGEKKRKEKKRKEKKRKEKKIIVCIRKKYVIG